MGVTRSGPVEANRGSGPASVQQGRHRRGMIDDSLIVDVYQSLTEA